MLLFIGRAKNAASSYNFHRESTSIKRGDDGTVESIQIIR